MEFIKKHLNQLDIQGLETYICSNDLKEYITCVKGHNSKMDTWTCIEGAYERYCDTDIDYDYKIIYTYKVPHAIKPLIFEKLYPDHKLIIDYTHLK
jgi:hypothetical protein